MQGVSGSNQKPGAVERNSEPAHEQKNDKDQKDQP